MTEGATVREVKPPLAPSIIVPFGVGLSTLDGVSGRSEAALRATLVGVERLVTGIGAAYRAQGLPEKPCFTLLPLSPNHGSFGGDGFYAEAKAALEAMLHKARSERDAWGAAMALCGARIGWCRGTGLMDANNPLAAMLERDHELRTFSAPEMGHALVSLCAEGVRRFAAEAPLYAKLDAGMGRIDEHPLRRARRARGPSPARRSCARWPRSTIRRSSCSSVRRSRRCSSRRCPPGHRSSRASAGQRPPTR